MHFIPLQKGSDCESELGGVTLPGYFIDVKFKG